MSYQNNKILILDDDVNLCEAFVKLLDNREYAICAAHTGKDGLRQLTKDEYTLVFCDLELPDINGIELIDKIKKVHPDIPIIMITAFSSIKTAVKAIKAGAYDYVEKPFDIESLNPLIKKILADQELIHSMDYIQPNITLSDKEVMIGAGKSMKKIFHAIKKVANMQSTVVITGESGTGKELVARAIHLSSQWRHEPFIAINCSAIPGTLLESELFGYEKGAFTGAAEKKTGKIVVAGKGGTVFLDEIGDMQLEVQAKILTALESRMITPLGSVEPIPVQTRFMAATNCDLEQLVAEKKMREDLYFRLNIIRIKLQPLRERKEDIPELVSFFINTYNKQFRKNVKGLSEEAIHVFKEYSWPGNIRQLKYAIERKMVFADEHDEYLEFAITDFDEVDRAIGESDNRDRLKMSLEDVEKEHIYQVLQSVNGRKSAAADILKIDRTTLNRKLKRYNKT